MLIEGFQYVPGVSVGYSNSAPNAEACSVVVKIFELFRAVIFRIGTISGYLRHIALASAVHSSVTFIG
jgi:hypothetical protein